MRSRNRNRRVIFLIEKMTWIQKHCFHYPGPKFSMATILGSLTLFDSCLCSSRKIQLASLHIPETLFPIVSLDRQHHHRTLVVLQIRSELWAAHLPLSQRGLTQKPGNDLVIYTVVPQGSNLTTACLELTSVLGVWEGRRGAWPLWAFWSLDGFRRGGKQEVLVPTERDLKGKIGHLKISRVPLKSYFENAMVNLSLKYEQRCARSR